MVQDKQTIRSETEERSTTYGNPYKQPSIKRKTGSKTIQHSMASLRGGVLATVYEITIIIRTSVKKTADTSKIKIDNHDHSTNCTLRQEARVV